MLSALVPNPHCLAIHCTCNRLVKTLQCFTNSACVLFNIQHMIVRADVGTKNITRYSYSYLSLFQQVKQEVSIRDHYIIALFTREF